MGISGLPAPSEGVLILLVANTAVTISVLKEIVRSLLQLVGVRTPSSASDAAEEAAPPCCLEPTAADRFRFTTVRFGSGNRADCLVCLSRFEPDSVVNRLACGHLFHRACLEKWLDYHHVTCPLCRRRLLPADEAANSFPSF